MNFILSFLIALIFSFSISAQETKDRPLAPTFKVAALDGKIFGSPDLKGKIIVLNLWFVNCPHCIEEIKQLNKIVDASQNNKDVVFIGLATNNQAELENFLKKNPFKYNIVANAGDFILFGFGDKQKDGSYFLPFPTHIVIDREGRIISKTSGVKGVEVVRSELARQFNKPAAQ